MARLIPRPSDAVTARFHAHHPDIDLRTLDLDDEAALAGLEGLDASDRADGLAVDRDAVLARLRIEQHLLSLHGCGEVAQRLADRFDSAHAIAAETRDHFVEHCAHAVGINPADAIGLHQRAVDRRARASLLEANLRDAAGPHYRASRFASVGPALAKRADEADGATLAAAGADGAKRSDFDPVKYALDLRGTITKHITDPYDARDRLSARRADLEVARMRDALMGDEVEQPYLQIVNEVIAERLKADDLKVADPIRHVAELERVFPFAVPHNTPLDRVRRCLGHLDLDLATIFERLGRPAADIARARLRLSHERSTIIGVAVGDEAGVAARFGSEGSLAEVRRVETLLGRTEMTREALDGLVHQDLHPTDEAALAKQLFVNRGRTDGEVLGIEMSTEGEMLTGLDVRTADRLLRFLRLARALGWSFSDLDWALTALGCPGPAIDDTALAGLAALAGLNARFDAPIDVLASLWDDIKTRGRGTGPAPADLFDRVFNAPGVFDTAAATPYRPGQDDEGTAYPRNPLFEDAPLKWAPGGVDPVDTRIRQRLRAALSLTDEALTILAAKLFPGHGTVALTVGRLSLLHRYATLAALLGLRVGELLVLRDAIGMATIERIDDVVLLTAWADRLAEAGVSPYTLGYLMTGAPGEYVDPGYSDADALLARLPTLPAITAPDLIGGGVDAPTAAKILLRLVEKAWIDEAGRVVRPVDALRYPALAADLADLLPAQGLPVLDFPGTDDGRVYVDCGADPAFALETALTVEFWVRGPGKTYGMTVHKGGYWGCPGYCLYWLGAGHNDSIDVGLLPLGPQSTLTLPNPRKDSWIHLAVTWDMASGRCTLFADGEAVQESAFAGPIGVDLAEHLQFGSATALNGYETHFVGHIADVRLWSVRRSAAEIRRDMHRRLSGSEPGLVGYWPLDEGEGARARDLKAGRHGAIGRHGAEAPPTWSVDAALPLDPPVMHVLDVLRANREVVDQTGGVMRSDLAAFFGVRADLLDAALRFAGVTTAVDPISTLAAGGAGAMALLAAVAHTLRLSQIFALGVDGLAGLLEYPAAFGWSGGDFLPISADRIRTLDRHRRLTGRFRALPGGLSSIFATDLRAERIAALSGWSVAEITGARSALGLGDTPLGVDEVHALDRVFALSATTGMNVAALARLSTLGGPVAADWDRYLEGAALCVDALDAGADSDDPAKWAALIAPLEDRAREALRDALGGYCGHRLGFEERLEDLYEHLLIDVEMSGCARISRVKEATCALQLYVHRCRAGLEPGTVTTIDDAAWGILGSYRRWQAQRKLEAYPENYLDPGLRKRKTDIYDQVLQEIQQSELTDDAAEGIYRTYLTRFAERANLEPLAACYARFDDPETGAPGRYLYVVGRGRVTPRPWYVRRLVVGVDAVTQAADITEWGPWQSLMAGSAIHADAVTPVFAFGRLFIFWVQYHQERHTRMAGGKSIPTTGTRARIQCVHQTPEGGWSSVLQLSDALVAVETDETADTEVKKRLPDYAPWMKASLNGDGLAHPAWRRPWAVYLPRQLGAPALAIFCGKPEGHAGRREFGPNGPPPLLLDASLTARPIEAEIEAPEGGPLRLLAHQRAVWQADADHRLIDTWYREVDAGAHGHRMLDVVPGARVVPVDNVFGWSLVDTVDEAFIAFGATGAPVAIAEEATASLAASTLSLRSEAKTPAGPLRFVRLGTDAPRILLDRLAAGGRRHLLHIDAQQAPEPDFQRLQPHPDHVVPPRATTLDFAGPYARYLREIFLHLPFLIAVSANGRQRQQEARGWYRHLFDPENAQDSPFDWPAERRQSEALVASWRFDGAPALEGAHTVELPLVRHFPGAFSRKVARLKPGASQVVLGKLLYALHFTIEFWLRFDDPPPDGERGTLLTERTERPVRIETHGRRLRLYANGLMAQTPPLEPQRWYHLAFQLIEGGGRWWAQAFVDGALQPADHDQNDTRGPQGQPFVLGLGNTRPVSIADLGFWNRSLSPVELRERAACSRAGYWRYLPLRAPDLHDIVAGLATPTAVGALAADPADPEVAAMLRPLVLQRALVMRTIDNLLDWGDALFAEDSWETNEQARMLYVQAGDILGRRPRYVPPPASSGLAAAADARALLERQLESTPDAALLAPALDIPPDDGFYTPENPDLVAYWDRVADRLYKLRHCMNLAGEVRTLALYRAPLDPRRMIDRAGGATGGDGPAIESGTHRSSFERVLPGAIRAAQHLRRMGLTLLQIVESLDGADVDMLDLAHEGQQLDLGAQIKDLEIAEHEAVIASLEVARAKAHNEKTYHTLMSIGGDGTPIDFLSLGFRAMQGVFKALKLGPSGLATALFLPPKIFGVATGAPQPGEAMKELAAIADTASDVGGIIADGLAYVADMWRRKAEQTAQATWSGFDIDTCDIDLAAARLRLDILQRERASHIRSQAQWVEKNTLIQGQFTGPDLYRWMLRRLSAVYLQAYKAAFERALAAERAYQFERNTTRSFVRFDHWDGLRKGLLAAEGLIVDLERLDGAWHDEEGLGVTSAESVISLRALDPAAWAALRTEGRCDFTLDEALFDREFPGHYCRRITSVGLSVQLAAEAATGGTAPAVRATLTQLGHRVVLRPDAAVVRTLLGEPGPHPTPGVLQADDRPSPRVAVSGRAGEVISLSGEGDRAPFAGTGAVSRWSLALPPAANRFDPGGIDDVTLHLRYTARDGGADLARQVISTAAVSQFSGHHCVSLRAADPAGWRAFTGGEGGHVALHVTPRDLHPGLDPDSLTLGRDARAYVALLHGAGVPRAALEALPLAINDTPWSGRQGDVAVPERGDGGWRFDFQLTHVPEAFSLSGEPGVDPDTLSDILLLVPYSGRLDWRGVI